MEPEIVEQEAGRMSESDSSSHSMNPFPGPVSLSSDYGVFGRDEEISNVRSLLLAERVVVLHGTSGAGKSSLLRGRGGLMDSFNELKGFAVVGPLDLRLPSGSKNIGNIYERTLIEAIVEKQFGGQSEDDDQLQAIMDLELLLLRHAKRTRKIYQILIIDQFEELFARYPYDEDGRKEFFRTLGGLVEKNPDFRLLLSMRDEYLGELDRFRRYMPGRLNTTFRLELLREEQAAQTIELTALDHPSKIRLCPDDVRALVANLSGSNIHGSGEEYPHHTGFMVEPLLLQLACRDAWPGILERAGALANSGTAAQNDCVSIPEGASSAELDQVLRRFFDSTIRGEQHGRPLQEHKLRMFVQDGLILPNGLRNLVSLDQARERWGLDVDVLNSLVESHLVRTRELNRITYYELAHDRLVRPVKDSNEKWLAKQPEWRRMARRLHLGGGGSRRVHWTETLGAWRARRDEPNELTPYEDDFIRDQKRNFSRVSITVVFFLFLTVAIGVAIAFHSEKQTRDFIAHQKKEILKTREIAKKAEQTAKEMEEKARAAREEVENEKSRTIDMRERWTEAAKQVAQKQKDIELMKSKWTEAAKQVAQKQKDLELMKSKWTKAAKQAAQNQRDLELMKSKWTKAAKQAAQKQKDLELMKSKWTEAAKQAAQNQKDLELMKSKWTKAAKQAAQNQKDLELMKSKWTEAAKQVAQKQKDLELLKSKWTEAAKQIELRQKDLELMESRWTEEAKQIE